MRSELSRFVNRGSASVLVGLTLVVAFTTARRAWSDVARKPTKLSPIRSGREWQVILVTSSNCTASKREDVQAAIRHILPTLQRQVLANGDQFSSLGVSIDWNVERGVTFLAGISQFHEVSVGRNWLNQAITRYMNAATDTAMTPTVLVVTRIIEANQRGIRVGNDSVVNRLVGAKAIIAFDGWLRGEHPPERATRR